MSIAPHRNPGFHIVRPFIWISVLCCFAARLPAQDTLCDQRLHLPTAMVDLAGNDITARITNAGDLWWDGNDGRYTVKPPVDTLGDRPIQAHFTAALWMAGRDPGGNIKAAAPVYGRNRGDFDYLPGPLNEDGVGEDCLDWDLIFTISREEINRALDLPSAGGIDTALIPDNVLYWPGTGNPYFNDRYGVPLPEHDMAPFVDHDGDGRYDPAKGDLPDFCGDQAVWTVFNDATLHRDSGTPNNVQAEVHLLAYSFNTPQDSVINRTTYYDYKIRNGGAEDLLGFHVGHFIDADVGCPTGDGVGSLPEHNAFYAYSVNGVDPPVCVADIPGFGNTAPVTVYQVIPGYVSSICEAEDSPREDCYPEPALHAFNTYLLGGLCDPPARFTLPNGAGEIYNVMQGKYIDGSPVYRSFRGTRDSFATITRYAYDGGLTADGEPWLQCTGTRSCESPTSYSTGPFDLRPNDVVSYTLAVTTVFNVDHTTNGGCPDTVPIIRAAERARKQIECCVIAPGGTTSISPAADLDLAVFPNPQPTP